MTSVATGRAVRGVTVALAALLVALGAWVQADTRSASNGVTAGSRPPTPGPTSAAARPEPEVASFDRSAHEFLRTSGSPDRTTVSPARTTVPLASAPSGRGVSRYLGQTLSWQRCGEFQCARVLVPLDWDAPDGPAIELAVRKAGTTSARRGTVFLNPGGPGASGTDFVARFPASVLPGFDVIGWDPRGTGESTAVRCGTPARTAALLSVDQSPDTSAEWRTLRSSLTGFATDCRENSGSLLDHVSTIDSARDLDYLRYLVGAPRLDYIGISYGTLLGATYAELYPTRVGAMVLDSAVDLTGRAPTGVGFDTGLDAFAEWCVARHCGLGDSAPQIVGGVRDLLERLDAHPLMVGDRSVGQSEGAAGVALPLYSGERGYPALTRMLSDARAGDGRALLRAADDMAGRREDGTYDPSTFALPAVSCLDDADPGWDAEVADWATSRREAPIFGTFLGPAVQCTVWSARPQPRMLIRAAGAPPILVLGATGDPVTPYAQSVAMAHRLESGRLVTWRGAGHSALMLGNRCVRDAVTDFLVDGRTPADGTVC